MSTLVPAKNAAKPNVIKTIVQPIDFFDCALILNSWQILDFDKAPGIIFWRGSAVELSLIALEADARDSQTN